MPRSAKDLHTTASTPEAEWQEVVPVAEEEPPPQKPAQDTRSPSVVMLDTVVEAAQRPGSPAGEKTPTPSSPDSLSTTGVPTPTREKLPESAAVPHTPEVLRLKLPVPVETPSTAEPANEPTSAQEPERPTSPGSRVI